MDSLFEFPRRPTGHTAEDVQRLWEDLWRVVEKLRLLQEELARKDAGNND
jgi:hypothetical protein